MRELTITEKYVLIILNDKGILHNSRRGNIVSAMLLDLEYEGFVSLDNDDCVSVVKELTDEYLYLSDIYEYIKMKDKMKVIDVKTYFTGYILYNKRSNNSIIELRNRMLKDDIIAKTDIVGKYTPNKNYLDKVVSTLRNSILKNGNLDEKTLSLLLLLKNTNKIVNLYFKNEKEKLNVRCRELEQSKKVLINSNQGLLYVALIPILVGSAFGSLSSTNSINIALIVIVVLSIIGVVFSTFIGNKNIWL